MQATQMNTYSKKRVAKFTTKLRCATNLRFTTNLRCAAQAKEVRSTVLERTSFLSLSLAEKLGRLSLIVMNCVRFLYFDNVHTRLPLKMSQFLSILLRAQELALTAVVIMISSRLISLA